MKQKILIGVILGSLIALVYPKMDSILENISTLNPITFIPISILLVGVTGALYENFWLGCLGSKRYGKQSTKLKGAVPLVIFLFPLPFTTYIYIFFRIISSKEPRDHLERVWKTREERQ